ncbi:MAG TPA: hypothetical protein VF814_03220 [Casimicrobiaceae bacterium]
MQLTLVIPGPFDLPASVLASADPCTRAFSRLLAADRAPMLEDDGLLASSCRALGIARQSDWPAAPGLARAAGLDPEGAYWLCAEPVTLVVGRDDVRLAGLVDDLDAHDAQSLVGALSDHFAADALRFFAPTPRHWFARIPSAQRLETRPPEAALGAPLFGFLPAGPDAARWRRWQSELQMLLFEHPANRARERSRLAPVNSVWLWGGGTQPERDAPVSTIFADDERIRDLARGSAVDCASVPGSFDALPHVANVAVWLAPVVSANAAAALAAIDRVWMAPIERALDAGGLSTVELIVGGRERAVRFAVRRASLVRRWRARFSPPRFSRLLADLAPELDAA